MKRVSKLFIINSVGMLGGATKSIKGLISNLNEKVDLMAPRNPAVSNKDLKDYFGPNINKVYRYYLPFRTSILGGKDIKQDWYITEILYRSDKKSIMEVISKNKYDYIHLNSYVLYPLINKKYPMYIHVREICKANFFVKKMIQMKFRNVKGIIYIDVPTKEALGIKTNCIVLNNPFDQEKVCDVDLANVRNRYSIQDNETVFSFVSASNNTAKGLDFVVESFVKAACKDTKLLVVGTNKIPDYEENHNIVCVGKISKMEEIYAVSDYILRGEEQFCIGRTVYEGLYSGCSVIIPGVPEYDSEKIFEYSKFKNNIFFYKPRDEKSLIQMFKARADKKKNGVLGLSNVKEYISRFEEFISV